MLVSATDRVAKRYRKTGFAIAFIVLGLLTSISEVSVMVNASLAGVPQISAGNLAGGSLVIFLLIIPLLAVLGNGVSMNGTFSTKGLISLLFIVALPPLFAMDGAVTVTEGVLMILAYFTLLYVVQKRRPVAQIIEHTVHDVEQELLHTQGFLHKKKATALDIMQIAFAGLVIFIAGKFLVHESVYFAEILSVPASLIGLVILSIGTNVPELVIAVRCVIGRHKDIAFGDYMGSAAANAPLMGLLVLSNGRFHLERSEFSPTFFLLAAGLVLFLIFSRTKHELSRKEGSIMLLLYGLFLAFQLCNFVQFVGE